MVLWSFILKDNAVHGATIFAIIAIDDVSIFVSLWLPHRGAIHGFSSSSISIDSNQLINRVGWLQC